MSDSIPAPTSSQDGPAVEARPSWPMDCWYFAGLTQDYKAGSQMRRMVLGEPVVVGRTATGELFALRDICPHRLVPLSAGRQLDTNGEPTLECPYHGWRFGTDGVCRLLPSLTEDDPTDPSRIRVRKYPVHDANGAIYIYVSSDARFQGVPESAPSDFGMPTSAPKRVGETVIEAPIAATIERFSTATGSTLIPTHWTWHPLHDAGDLGEPSPSNAISAWKRDHGSVPVRSWRLRNLLGTPVSIESELHPTGFRLDRVRGSRAELQTLSCLVPETPNSCRLTVLAWSDRGGLTRLLASKGVLPARF